MKYLLDTNIISELVSKNPNKYVLSFLEKQDEDFIFLSVVTIGEIKSGALADIIALKQDPTKNIESLQNIDWIMKDGKVYKQHK